MSENGLGNGNHLFQLSCSKTQAYDKADPSLVEQDVVTKISSQGVNLP